MIRSLFLALSLIMAAVATPVVAPADAAPVAEVGSDVVIPPRLGAQFQENPYRGFSDQLFPMPPCGDFQLEEASIDDMQAAMANGTLTSVQLVTCYMMRVYQTDDYINSIQQLNPDVLAIASARDAERASGLVRSPLHGIPFTVKDNVATRDRMETTAGSWALLGSVSPRDAHVVSLLRDRAGAVLMGKATMSEWADMRSNNYSEGYSARGGQARSPYNLTLNPGGSSSGSAAGVAANVVAFSLGTETDGSVINPAERNAIVGFKPTVGLTSRAGVIPECEHQDTVGTFGKTVKDAVLALDGIYGVDPRDNYTLAQEGKTPTPSPDGPGYSQYLCDRSCLRGATFGLPWSSFWAHADAAQRSSLLALVSLVEAAGATVVNGTEILDHETIVSPDGWDWDYGGTRGRPNESEYTVVKVDFYNNIAAYLSELEGNTTDVRSLEDIIAYNLRNDGTEGGNPWPLGNAGFYSGQDGFLASAETKGVRDETYWQALGFTSGKTRAGIDHALGLVPPSTSNASSSSSSSCGGNNDKRRPSGLLVPPDVGQTYQIAAQAGYPMVTIPVSTHAEGGSGGGMPFGLAIMHTAWAEDELVRWASAIEDLQRWDRASSRDDAAGGKGQGEGGGRTLPKWFGYLRKNVPVL